MNDPAASVVRVRDWPLRVLRSGAGPALLLLHGEGGAETSTALMSSLARDFDVILPEHPGFGGTEIPAWLDKVSDLANFYLEFLDQLDLRRIHLVGLSLGGWIAADLAVRNAGRLASLALIAAPGIYVKGAAQIDPFMHNEEQSVRDLFHDERLAERMLVEMLRPETEDLRLGNRLVEAKLSWDPRFHDPQLERWLHRIRIPTLIAWGEDDRLFPKDYAFAWQRLIPGSALKLLGACGHAPAIEQTEELASAIRAFCSKESVPA